MSLMNVKGIFLIFAALFNCCTVESKVIPYFVYSGAKSLLQSILGGQVQKAAYRTNKFLEKNSGVDMSLGDISEMRVEMVRVLEPFEKYVVVSDYVNNRLKHVTEMMTSLFAQKPASKKDFNEYVALTIVLNETEVAAAEVLMSTTPCLLDQSDYYFQRSNDPCLELSKKSIASIMKRIEKVQKKIETMGSSVQVPGAWDAHLRHVVGKMDLYSDKVLNEKQQTSWNKIKEYILSKQLL